MCDWAFTISHTKVIQIRGNLQIKVVKIPQINGKILIPEFVEGFFAFFFGMFHGFVNQFVALFNGFVFD